MENILSLVSALRQMPTETTWLEFKHNNYDPEMIGQSISALANSATLNEKSCAYMLWGIHDETHEIIGTQYNQYTLKIGNQEIESWLRNLLSANADFEFQTIEINEKSVTILFIHQAVNQTVSFKKVDFIRVGSYTKRLNEYPTMQAQLWDKLRTLRYEDAVATKDLQIEDALGLIDYDVYFDLKQEPRPSNHDQVLHYMIQEGIILKQANGLYGITNMGAILFARQLTSFPRISRKAVRIIQYSGDNRFQMLKEDMGIKGYAVGFSNLLKYIEALLPSIEVIQGALREKRSTYPTLAVREAIANALIHQDFSISGSGPVVEIFEHRIEVTNPGTPLVDIKRIIDNPPKSRNERLASLMRRLRMCEELGSGWDKIAISCERQLLPAPKIHVYDESTRVTLFAQVPFSNIPPEDKIWACYLHACIKQVSGDVVTNSSLRERFGLEESASASISRLIKECVNQELIKPIDPNTAPRYMKYVPIWA